MTESVRGGAAERQTAAPSLLVVVVCWTPGPSTAWKASAQDRLRWN